MNGLLLEKSPRATIRQSRLAGTPVAFTPGKIWRSDDRQGVDLLSTVRRLPGAEDPQDDRSWEGLLLFFALVSDEVPVANRLRRIVENHDDWREDDEPPLSRATVRKAWEILETFGDRLKAASLSIFMTETGGLDLQARKAEDVVIVTVDEQGIKAQRSRSSALHTDFGQVSRETAGALLAILS